MYGRRKRLVRPDAPASLIGGKQNGCRRKSATAPASPTAALRNQVESPSDLASRRTVRGTHSDCIVSTDECRATGDDRVYLDNL